jgi:uncharacterized protein
MNTLRSYATLACLALAFLAPPASLYAQPVPKRLQFIYVLKVMPKFHEAKDWTATENTAVGRHFERLSKAAAEGQVILAGRTSEALSATFGVVIFEADNEPAARQFMETDPAVVAGVMTATLHPYVIALQRKP